MNFWVFLIWCLLPVFILWSAWKASKRSVVARKHLRNKHTNEKGDLIYMLNLINQFIGKKCNIVTIEKEYTGVIESVEENWIVVQDAYYETKEIINLEYVTGISQCKEKLKKLRKERQEA